MLFGSFVITCAVIPIINKMEKFMPRVLAVTLILFAMILASILIIAPLLTISTKEAIELVNDIPNVMFHIGNFLNFEIFGKTLSDLITFESLKDSLGAFGPIFICVSMSLFAFTTLIGNYSYCEGCLRFILKREPSKALCIGFRIFASLIVFVGAIVQMAFVWDTADLLQGLMVIVNVPVIVILANTAVKALKDYTTQKKAGLDPEFKASSIDLKEDTDFWK